jgi:HlyD family secretion protein
VGQAANIEVDALPDTVLEGKVTEIANTAFTLGRGTQEEVTNFKVKVAILDDITSLRPGMSATVDIETASHEDVLYVPIQCVVMRSPKAEEGEKEEKGRKEERGEMEGEEGAADEGIADTGEPAKPDSEDQKDKKEEEREPIEVVFVVEDDAAKMVPVKTGISSDTDTEILSGLEGGEMIVTGSYRALRDLRDGQKVKIEKQPEGKLGEEE